MPTHPPSPLSPPRDQLGPALAAIELTSLARGWAVCDALVKRAASRLWRAHPISAGRFLILLRGPVAEVSESYTTAVQSCDGTLLDSVLLPQVASPIPNLLQSNNLQNFHIDALGLVETSTCTSTLRAADAALKMSDVHLAHIHLGQGIDGKGFFAFSGALHDVQASLEAAVDTIPAHLLVHYEEIPQPHPSMTLSLLGRASASPFY